MPTSIKVCATLYPSGKRAVHLELEVESALAGDTQTLQDRIRALFRLARSAVDEELAGHGATNTAQAQHGQTLSNGHHAEQSANRNGHHPSNGTEHMPRRLATASQVRAIHAIANRRKLNLHQELQTRYGYRFAEQLSLTEASQLIDAFKAMEAEADF